MAQEIIKGYSISNQGKWGQILPGALPGRSQGVKSTLMPTAN